MVNDVAIAALALMHEGSIGRALVIDLDGMRLGHPLLDVGNFLAHLSASGEGDADIVAAGFDPQTVARVVRLVDRNEYKRRQAAPTVRVSEKAFGSGRDMPIAQRWRKG